MKDESRGLLPSASSIGRYFTCEGAYKLSMGVEDFRTQEMINWAETGDLIHSALAGEIDSATLPDEHQETYAKCVTLTSEACSTAGLDDPHNVHTMREQRLWLSVAEEKLLSGKSDFIAIDQTKRIGLVLDYKTGRGEQDPIDENHQLRTYIVLAAEQYGYVETWYGGIVQPWASNKVTLVKYERDEVLTSRANLIQLIDRITKDGRPTNSGLHCKFCPAVLKCDSARALLQTFGLIDGDNAEGETLSQYLVLAKAAKPIIERLQARAKAMLAKNPASVPGWQISDGGSQRKVVDPFKCFTLVIESGILDRDTFLNEAVSVGVGDLESAVVKYAKEIKKEKLTKDSAKALVSSVCLPVIAFVPKAGSLEQV